MEESNRPSSPVVPATTEPVEAHEVVRFCETAGHEQDRASGSVRLADTGTRHDYCSECIDLLDDGENKVARLWRNDPCPCPSCQFSAAWKAAGQAVDALVERAEEHEGMSYAYKEALGELVDALSDDLKYEVSQTPDVQRRIAAACRLLGPEYQGYLADWMGAPLASDIEERA